VALYMFINLKRLVEHGKISRVEPYVTQWHDVHNDYHENLSISICNVMFFFLHRTL
jgi:hypothetical protein